MRRLTAFLFLATVVSAVPAAGDDDGPSMTSGANVRDLASVQRGAALFVNYCQSCHSAEYMRYQRLAQDLDLTEGQVQSHLAFGDVELADYMTTAMTRDQATEWLSAPPPDLTLSARSLGGDWIYTFLMSFYLTEDGWNNWKFPNTSMPHVLWDLQGIQRPVFETYADSAGVEQSRVVGLELDQPGRLGEEDYRLVIRDLVAFMEYLAEPGIVKRKKVGVWVILFLTMLSILTYILYKEYWRDVR